MVEVRKRDNESFEGMLRRFTRRMQQSRILNRARKSRFHSRTESRNMRRARALKKAELREVREEMKLSGKLSYNTFGSPRGMNPRKK